MVGHTQRNRKPKNNSDMSSSGISATVPSSSLIESSILDDADNLFALATFRNLIKSCYGPNARLKTIQHHNGGQVTLTSSSCVLLRSLPVRRPFLRLLVTAVTEHLRLFSDGGLFVAFLASELISVCCLSGKLPRILYCDVNSVMLDWCNDFMSTSEKCRIHVDISNMSQMMAVVRSIISTKPACCFTRGDISHVSSLILQAFLKTFPTSDHQKSTQQCIQYIDVPGHDTQNSQVVDGVLFQLPKDTPDKILPPGGRFISDTGPLKVALFNISLAGDTDDFLNVRYEVCDGLSPMGVVTDRLFDIARRLLEDGVDVLGCQKVIHPSIKKFLTKNGVLAIDRLSIVNIAAVEKLSGAQCISSLHCDNTMRRLYGRLEKLQISTFFQKSYYHFVNKANPVCTLILCSRLEATLNEIKSVCKVAQSALLSLMINPTVVPGAGCFEVLLSNHLKQKVQNIDRTLCASIGCSEYQFKLAAQNFIQTLRTVASCNQNGYPVTNLSQSHLWIIPEQTNLDSHWVVNRACNCGLCRFDCSENIIEIRNANINSDIFIKSSSDEARKESSCTDTKMVPPELHENVVIDQYDAKMNGLNVAVETGNLILRIHRSISMS